MWVDAPAVYLHREPVDFRKSVDGLAAIVEGELERSPFSGAVYVFCNRQRNKLKVLYWDATGFALWYKRLEQEKFAWPRHSPDDLIELSAEQWQWLLSGYDITRLHPHARVQYTHMM